MKATRPGLQIVDTSLFLLCSFHFNVFFIRFKRSSKVQSRKHIPLEASLRETTEIKYWVYQSHTTKSCSVFWWISVQHIIMRGTRSRSSLGHCATSRKVAGSIPDRVNGPLHWHETSSRYGPEVDSASNRNEYQEYFLRGKSGRCIRRTTLLPPCTDCLEIWEPQPPGSLRARPGIALTLPFTQTL